MTENKLNRLERSIVNAEDAADGARWLQAEEVVRRLNADETERDVAASWTNLRTKRPYDHKHVNRCAKLWRTFGGVPPQDRPAWADAYANLDRANTRSERAQAQAPTTIETAQRLVENIMRTAPPEVRETIRHELVLAESAANAPRVKVPDMDPWFEVGGEMALVERHIDRLAVLAPETRMDQHRQDEIDEWLDRVSGKLQALRTRKGRADLRAVGADR